MVDFSLVWARLPCSATKPADLRRCAGLLFFYPSWGVDVSMSSLCSNWLFSSVWRQQEVADNRSREVWHVLKTSLLLVFPYWPVVFITCALFGPRNDNCVHQQTCMYKPSWLQTASVAEVIADKGLTSMAESSSAITPVTEFMGLTKVPSVWQPLSFHFSKLGRNISSYY